jgi:hypothetical protein
MRQIVLGLGMALLLSACGDPLRNVARLGDVAVADGATNVAQAPIEAQKTGGGLFARLLNRQANDPTNSAVAAAMAQTGQAASAQSDVAVAPAATTPSQPERRGLFGLFGRDHNRAAQSRTGPDATDITPGALLPFGQIARVCGLNNNQLGRQIDGGGGFRIYDTIPNSTARRPFYISGFDDGCVRTFTGAVVVTGDVETHEFVRYQTSNQNIDYTTTDNAYEALKASVCRVGRGQPCGTRLERMNSNTHFITVYDFFDGTFSAVPTRWAQILVHDGDVLSMSVKDGT